MAWLSSLVFTTPAALAALLALPLIWWLLRFTPPRPAEVRFPPFRLLLDLISRDETPDRTPWWIVALRMAMAAAIILAVAGPLIAPGGPRLGGAAPLLVVVDDGWAAAPGWPERRAGLERLLDEARRDGAPAALATTAPSLQASAPVLGDAAGLLATAAALEPKALTPDRMALAGRLGEAFAGTDALRVVWLSDGLDHGSGAAFATALAGLANGRAAVEVLDPGAARMDLAVARPDLRGGRIAVGAVRGDAAGPAAARLRLKAGNGRTLAETEIAFATGAAAATAEIELPLELRNEAHRLEIADLRSAGAVFLFDDRWRRKSVAMLSGAAVELEQPLLSPLYYVGRALQPTAEASELRSTAQLAEAVERGVSMVVLADIGVLGPEAHALLEPWIEEGGVLVRFAGPRLAGGTDGLVPVELRTGGRDLGSALSWEQPQDLAPFPADGPFAGLAVDPTVKINRQVLAEPTADLAGRTWASLADGTPLVTAERRGTGLVVLFHVTASADWSNLPLAGLFVEMLNRLVDLAPAAGAGPNEGRAADAGAPAQPANVYTPIRSLDGHGELAPPPPGARPAEGDGFLSAPPTPFHPAGLYSRGGAVTAHNLALDAASLAALGPLPAGVAVSGYLRPDPTRLAGWLFALATALFVADAAAMLWITGAASGLARRRRAAAVGLAALAVVVAEPWGEARAQEAVDDTDAFAMRATLDTRLAYVLTGDSTVDDTSFAGLAGLGQILVQRTSIEPAEPMAVDLARDDIAFFPILYWPVLAEAGEPEPAVLAKIGDYMKSGGTIFFDTRDDTSSVSAFTGEPSPATRALRRILDKLDIPPLEPAPPEHVVTRAFYLLQSFPGRWAGGELWVETAGGGEPGAAADGVSSIIIGANDYAGAWALDAAGQPVYPVVPGGEGQREMAFRTGVNIIMYALTGNYKADQVHVPALLERLGQ